ncbi:MAG: AI-2E family transporter [archaeon]
MEYKLFNRYFAITIVIILFIVFFYYLLPYINAFFGALILFFLFYPLYKLLTTKLKFGKVISAIIIIIITLIIVIVPTIFVIKSATNEINNIISNSDEILAKISVVDAKYPAFHITDTINKNLPEILSFGTDLLVNQINTIIQIIIILFIMYCLLYYLFLYHDVVEKRIKKFLPFNKANSDKLVSHFRKVTMAVLISSGLVGLIQGSLLGLMLFIFGVKGAILWGILGFIVSILPILDLGIIYISIAIVYFINQNYFVAFGILICGIIIGLSDYFLRPRFHKKFGDIHPLVSIIGVIVGIATFGFIGLIIGPLLITYLLLTYKMFMKEYVKK